MKIEEIFKVTISEDDIINLIKNYLLDNGVEAINDIKINLENEDISDDYDRYPVYRYFISPTIIECKKYENFKRGI